MTNEQELATPCRRYLVKLPSGDIATIHAASQALYLLVATTRPDLATHDLAYVQARLVNGVRLNGHRWLPLDWEQLVERLVNDGDYPLVRIH